MGEFGIRTRALNTAFLFYTGSILYQRRVPYYTQKLRGKAIDILAAGARLKKNVHLNHPRMCKTVTKFLIARGGKTYL